MALFAIHWNRILLMQLPADYEQQRLHLMRKYGIDLEDNHGDGSRTKRLDRKDFEALMGGDGRSGIFTWREKNRRKVRAIIARQAFSSSFHAPVSWRTLCMFTISDFRARACC